MTPAKFRPHCALRMSTVDFLLSRFAASLLLLLPATGSAATVAYWSFDDGAPPSAATTLTTEFNSPALNGTGTGHSGGSAPLFSSAVRAPEILASGSGPLLNTSNTAALYFTNPGLPGNPNSASASIVSIADGTGAGSILKLTNFTIEGFIRFEDFANFTAIFTKNRADTGGSSWMLDTNDAGNLRARFDTQPIGQTSGSGWNQSFSTTAQINNGQWHHVALTYAAATRKVDLYMDYVRVGGGTATNALVYDDNALRLGGSGGGRGFDGWMDEVRLSDTALTPAEFIAVVPEPTSALCLLSGATVALLFRRRR